MLPLPEPPMHRHDGLGLHYAVRHHDAAEYARLRQEGDAVSHVHEWETQNVCETCGAREAAPPPLDGLTVAPDEGQKDLWGRTRCGAILNCARVIHVGDDRHERADGISWHWHETALPHRSAAPPPLDRLREAGDGYEVLTWVSHQPSGVVVLQGHPQLGGRYCETDGGDWPCAKVRAALRDEGETP